MYSLLQPDSLTSIQLICLWPKACVIVFTEQAEECFYCHATFWASTYNTLQDCTQHTNRPKQNNTQCVWLHMSPVNFHQKSCSAC